MTDTPDWLEPTAIAGPEIPKKKRTSKKEIVFFSDEDLVSLWLTFEQRWHDPEWNERIWFSMLLLSTGLRIEEATQISVDACRDDFVIEILSGKGNKARLVEVHPTARPFYLEYLRRFRFTQQEFLFPGKRRPKGCPEIRSCVSVRKARDWWRDVLELAKVNYKNPHKARSTFATWGAESMSPRDMQAQLGHADGKTTRAYYWESIPGRRFEKPKPEWLTQAERIAEAFRERETRHLRVVGE